MLIDTHCHLNFNAFKEDRDEVVKRSLDEGMRLIMPGTQYATSKRAVEIADRYPQGVYAAVGLHPIHVGEKRKVDMLEVESEVLRQAQDWMTFETREETFDFEAYQELCKSEKVVAIGECGLDYYYQPKSKAKRAEFQAKQKEVFEQHVALAQEQNLPLIIHCRKAHDDLLEFLNSKSEIRNPKLRGVVHCYTGTVEQAQKFIDFGLYLGFNGLILKDVPALPRPEEVIASVPLERILLETDSPYLVPPQADAERPSSRAKLTTGQPRTEAKLLVLGRNEPLFLKYVAQEIARIKKLPVEEVSRVTSQNAVSLFNLSGNSMAN